MSFLRHAGIGWERILGRGTGRLTRPLAGFPSIPRPAIPGRVRSRRARVRFTGQENCTIREGGSPKETT